MVGGKLKGFGWFLYKYRKVRGKKDFFLVRLVRTQCKRNYFVLQYIITIFRIRGILRSKMGLLRKIIK